MPACSVPYCANASGKDSHITFHEFPHETPLFLNKWVENIGRPNWRPGVRSTVCSDHFAKDDFDRRGRLRFGSFPSKFPESPFRKKKKTQLDGTSTQPSKIVIPQSVTASATVEEPALDIEYHIKQELDNETHDVHFNLNSATAEKISLLRTNQSPESANINITKENRQEVIMGDDQSVRIIEPSPKPFQSFETPKKRKVLEETDSSKLNSGHVGSVMSSYSLLSCRICGVANKLNIHIFREDGKKLGLAELIQKCLPIKVSESDSLPQYLCFSCISRLKEFGEMISQCSKTNKLFGVDEKTKDPPIIHSKPVLPQLNNGGEVENRRVLLLEMWLKEGIQVKSMIAQAIDELNLRLQPKELREARPQGRIMFLDLHGGSHAYAEQMKRAVSMLFPSSQGETKPAEKRKIVNPANSTEGSTQPYKKIILRDMPIVQSAQAHKPSKPSSVTSTAQSVVPLVNPMASKGTVQSQGAVPKTVTATNILQSQGASTKTVTATNISQSEGAVTKTVPVTATNRGYPHSAVLKSVPSTMSGTTMVEPKVIVTSLGAVTSSTAASLPPLIVTSMVPNLAQVRPAVPVTLLPGPAGILATLQGSLPPGSVPQLVCLPRNQVPILPKPNTTAPSVVPQAKGSLNTTASDDDNHSDDHNYDSNDNFFMEDDHDGPPPMPDSTSLRADSTFPSLVPIKGKTISNGKPKEAGAAGTPKIDLACLQKKVLTKINNNGKQFKLGDKIVGIVVRKADSKEDIQRKIQATLSSANPVKDSGKPKGGTILTKGSKAIPVVDLAGNQALSVKKKPKDRPMDVHSTVDSPCSYFERRNARKLSLSFMWKKTGYLVSSYQKLFTWQLADNVDVNPIITCRVCKFEATSKQDVESHLQAHPDLQCTICYKYFLTIAKVHEHVSVIHKYANPAEALLKKKAPTVSWRYNTLRQGPTKQYQCSRCDRRFKSRDALQKHVGVCKERSLAERAIAVSSGGLINCTVCNRSFASPADLQEHTLIHTKRTSWLCDVCGLVLKSAANYRTHIARHDENAHNYQYQCTFCKKRFKLLFRYETHLKKHENKQNFMCSACGKCFNTLNGLRQHEVLHGERKLQCSFCPSRFHRRDHLRIHEASHSKGDRSRSDGNAVGPRLFTCRFCVAKSNTVVKFPNMRDLMRHYNDEHASERASYTSQSKRFECDRCTRSFSNATLLKHHHMWHAGIQPYSCSFCGAGFMVKERLRNHELTHTNERPFKCETCGKGFRSRNCLKQHKSTHMDPSQMLKCKYCDKNFSRIDNLRTHIRVHTGLKPWKCLLCQKPFRLRSECTKHIQIAHHIPPIEVLQYMETVGDPNSAEVAEPESNSSASAIETAIAGITTVQEMELLIEADDLDENSL